MDSKTWKLDFGMQILLTHAMKSEAGLIRQHYPLAKTTIRENGQEMIQLDEHLALLRTGIGLERCERSMGAHVNPAMFDLVVHFGVSGSLTDDLRLFDIVKGVRYSRPGDSDIWIDPPKQFADLTIPEAVFFSSLTAVTDDTAREKARGTGAEAVDMESYAIAAFCQVWGIPLLAIRCISDRAGLATPEDFKNNYPQATKTLQEFLLGSILNKLQ